MFFAARPEMPNHGSGVGVECCVPSGCLFGDERRVVDNLHDAVKTLCSSEQCRLSGLMHRQCFDSWESHVLQYLRTAGGRARQWTERQRQQNLWTKKGYDLAFKVIIYFPFLQFRAFSSLSASCHARNTRNFRVN